MASANQGHSGAKHTFGYGLAAAVTATPTTRNERPLTTPQSGGLLGVSNVQMRVRRVIWSPWPTSSASAKPASSTTPPSRTQVPWVSSGWSTDAAAGSRPTAHTPAAPPTTSPPDVRLDLLRPSASSSAAITGYGPLWSMTPGALVRASMPARSTGSPTLGSGAKLATTSGPAVASRVRS
jgi:hypothetical protein